MQLRESNRTLSVGGVQDTNQFSIKATGKAFKILSDGLYSDKPRAIIRELCCNAWDSHVAAGHQRPFEVKLPSQLDPSFWVRDFGTGLDHSQVMHLYTTYFDSTKNDSNDYTGGLGLGSKSPFSYTDQFTVTSWYGGRERVYSAYIGENGAPGISLLANNPSMEPGGLKVGIAIQRDHFAAFRSSAQVVLPWFPTKPIVKGVSGEDATAIADGPAVAMEGPGFLVLKSGAPSVLMGNVLYPIDLNHLPSRYGQASSPLRPGYREDFPTHLYSVPLVLKMPIGSLDIAASREALSYDEATIQALKQAFVTVNDVIRVQISEELESINPTSVWDANIQYKELLDRMEQLTRRFLTSSKGFVWQGHEINGKINIPTDWDIRMRTATQLPFSRWNPAGTRTVEVHPNTVIFLVDEKTKWGPKIEHWIDENSVLLNSARGYTHRWGRRSGTTDLRQKVLYVVQGEDLDKVEAKLKGASHMYRTSQLPQHPDHVKVAGTTPAPRKALNSKVHVWDSHSWREPTSTPDTSNATKIFRLYNGKTTPTGTAVGATNDVYDLFQACYSAGIFVKDETLFGVPASHRNVLKKLDLEDGFAFIKRRVLELAKEHARDLWLLEKGLAINNERLLHRGWDYHHLCALKGGGIKDAAITRLCVLKKMVRERPRDLEIKLLGLRNVLISLDKMGVMVYNNNTAGGLIHRYATQLNKKYGMGTMYFDSYEVRTNRKEVHEPWVDYVLAINHWHNRESTGDTE